MKYKPKKLPEISGSTLFRGAISGTRTHGMLEPQSSVLTNFTITAMCLIILTYRVKFVNI